MAVDDDHPLEPRARQRPQDIADVSPERLLADPQRSVEGAMLLGDADGHRRTDRHLVLVALGEPVGGRLGDRPRTVQVHTEGGVWAVLLGAADREQRHRRLGVAGIGPTVVCELHT